MLSFNSVVDLSERLGTNGLKKHLTQIPGQGT